MKILKNVEIVDLGLYLVKEKILIISDLHIGYEEALNKQGFLIPRFQFEDTLKRLKKILKKIQADTIVINGDLKHEFGSISKQEWNEVLGLVDFLKNYRVILVKGNHDNILKPMAEKGNMEIVERFDTEDISVVHGDKILDKLNKVIIIGHEHPAISFSSRPDEKYKCFLKGKWKKHELIVMPSFLLISEGTDITKEKLLSPYLKQDLSSFRVYVVEDKVYDFGTLKNI